MANEPMTYRQIADQLGISEMMVRKIESRALAKLRKSGKLEMFYDMLLDNPIIRSDTNIIDFDGLDS